MNKIVAKVTDIQSVEALNIVEMEFNGEELSMMSLELPQAVKIGSLVKLICKPTHVGIGKDITGSISCSNILTCRLLSLNIGELLCSLKLSLGGETMIESIITKKSALAMELKEGETLYALIKANDLSIQEVLHDRSSL